MKKSVMFCLVCIILFLFGVTAGMSFAYFSDDKKASSILNFGKLRIAIDESNSVTLTGNPKGAVTERLLPNDTVTINGSVGLESGSVPAYIRMKINVYEKGTNNEIYSTFNNAFMAEMAKIKDGDKQWFVVGNYMYLGNKIEAGNPFVYSEANTNENRNVITLTEEMVPEVLQEKDVDVKLTYQAIQSMGVKDASGNALTLTGYTQANANKISVLEPWLPFNSLADEYSLGTWTAPTHVENAMDARGTFNKGAQKEGKYTHIEFGTYPQTFYSTSSEGLTLTDETYTLYNNAKDNAGIKKDYKVYKDASGNKYVEITTVRSSFEKGWKYSDNTTYIEGSTTTAYFKLEPIIWEIIGVADSKNEIRRGGYDGKTAGVKLLLNSVKELTAMKFGETNAYANSTIKSYLEGEFYTYAFTSEEKSKISKKAIVTTDKTTIGNEDTNSTVFLLSYKDLNTTYYTSNKARIKWPTDYAGANFADRRINEANYGGKYWSRSMYESNTDAAYCVDEDGNSMSYGFSGLNVKYGVVPALFLNIQ